MQLRDLIVPQELKKEFRKIWGKLYTSVKKIELPSYIKIIAVGDGVSYSLIKSGLKPWIIVFDGRIERKKASREIVETLQKYCAKEFRVRNPAGCITSELWKIVRKSLKQGCRVKIFVEGEEDLAAFPFILEGKENDVVIYGLRKKGIVVVGIDKKLKNKGQKLLNILRACKS